jgi:outer membrane protein assembly factor BamB
VKILCLDARSGSKLKEFEVGQGVEISTFAVLDSLLIVTTPEGKLSAFDIATGQARWSLSDDDNAWCFLLVDQGRIYAHKGNEIFCLQPQEGSELWRFNVEGPVLPPAVADGQVFVGGALSKLFCLDVRTGVKKWEVLPWPAGVTEPLCVAEKRVFTGGLNAEGAEEVACLDAQSGAVLWRLPVFQQIAMPPAVAGKRLFLTGLDGIVCVDVTNGKTLWENTQCTWGMSPPVVSKDRLYFSSISENDRMLGPILIEMQESELNAPLSRGLLIFEAVSAE